MFKPKIFLPLNISRTKQDNALITSSFKNDAISLLDWFGIDLLNGSSSLVLSQAGTWVSNSAGGTPSLPLNSVQYNNAGSFGGDALFVRDPTTKYTSIEAVTLPNRTSGVYIDTDILGSGISASGLLTANSVTLDYAYVMAGDNGTGAATVLAKSSDDAGDNFAHLLIDYTDDARFEYRDVPNDVETVVSANAANALLEYKNTNTLDFSVLKVDVTGASYEFNNADILTISTVGQTVLTCSTPDALTATGTIAVGETAGLEISNDIAGLAIEGSGAWYNTATQRFLAGTMDFNSGLGISSSLVYLDSGTQVNHISVFPTGIYAKVLDSGTIDVSFQMTDPEGLFIQGKDTGSTNHALSVFNGNATPFTGTALFRVRNDGKIITTTGIDTTAGDSVTIDAASGRFRKDTSGSSFVLTNSFITANSIILLTNTTAGITTGNQLSVVAGAGSATITFETNGVAAAPSANMDINFLVIN